MNTIRPTSLTYQRVLKLLPKMRKRGRNWKVVWSKDISVQEAEYILWLDNLYTPGEVASFLLGRICSMDGLNLVSLAEKKLGRNVVFLKISDKNNDVDNLDDEHAEQPD